MYKKLIAMIMVFAMLVSISPAVAAEDAPAKPTVEEILNEYHQKSFETQNAQERSTASANSRSTSGSSQTPEQEAIEQLHEAGYEAYNVTAENYNALESTLMCDFEDLGLDPNGSYIVVIHGEDENNNEGNPNSRAFDGPTQGIFDPGGSGSSFLYNYQGKTYAMRYVTVTPTEIIDLSQSPDSGIRLLDYCPENLLANALNLSLTVLSFVPAVSTEASILSLLLSAVPDAPIATPTSLIYAPTSIWNITYTQVYHFEDQKWKPSAGVEYVIPQYFLDYYYYNSSTRLIDRVSFEDQLPTIYSEHYNDTEYIKQQAALAFEYNTCSMDAVERIVYKYNGNVIATHYRKWEYIDFTPPS